jgi:hypothetical protein
MMRGILWVLICFLRGGLAHPRGFEPLTLWFEARCAIRLRQGCVFNWRDIHRGNVWAGKVILKGIID